MKKIILLLALLGSLHGYAQKQPDVISKEDSIAIINELKADLELLFGKAKKSRGEVSAGLGTGYFMPNDLQKATTVLNKIFYNVAGGYYHKSGLGIDLQSRFMNDNNRFTMFQTSISPSYTYLKNRKFTAGISYTRYVYSDSLSFYTTPMVNEWQVYGQLRKLFIQPTVILNVAHGSRQTYYPKDGNTPDLTITEKASDISVMASGKHTFSWSNLLVDDDGVHISPSIMAIAGTSNYAANFASESSSGANNLLNIVPKKDKKKATKNTVTNTVSSSQTTTASQTSNTGFRFQSMAFVLGAEYQFKQYFIQPQYLVNYSFYDDGTFTNVFNVSIGVSL